MGVAEVVFEPTVANGVMYVGAGSLYPHCGRGVALNLEVSEAPHERCLTQWREFLPILTMIEKGATEKPFPYTSGVTKCTLVPPTKNIEKVRK